jgi:UDP-N-acetylmuramoyl-L-alanyl-D-glutamate--2,6-diaminopimelate ligase
VSEASGGVGADLSAGVSVTSSAVMDALAWARQAAGVALRDLQLDSRRVQPGDVFLAVPGRVSDGRNFVDAAVKLGAACVLVEAEGWSARKVGVPLRTVPQLSALLGQLSARYYGMPSSALLSVGVTGTNGKTSVSQWIAQALSASGRRCAVIGTVGSGFPDAALTSAALTTPDAVSLHKEVRRLADAGACALAMEVSSIGLDQGRVQGMKYDVAVFTNLTRDHLDYHGTMQAYEAAKTRLFDWPTLTHAVINLDDAMGRRLVQRLAKRVQAGALRLIGTTQQDTPDPADNVLTERLLARNLRSTADGLEFVLQSTARPSPNTLPLSLPLVGTFNVSNVLVVAGALLAAGVEFRQLPQLLAQLRAPAGRMQRVGGRIRDNEPLAVIDYAHTPDALEKALAALRPLAAARGGKLWAVFGAGGDRDPGKRAPMGQCAAAGADRLVLTTDNPRSEAPLAIIEQIAQGVPHCVAAEKLIDRAAAIAHAIGAADARDVVLIAGKGHEDYQIVGQVRTAFSDLDQAASALARRSLRHQPLHLPALSLQEGERGPSPDGSDTARNGGRSIAC